MMSAMVAPGVALASPPTTAIRYFYDADGRLKTVYNPASETALSSWDPAGNLLSVARHSSTVLSISELAPEQGAVGETMTIDGTGFSTTASSDTVKFNGMAATVTAATAWALTVKVPTGATTGTVTVKTPTEGPVTSAQTFTVAASAAPHVTSLSTSIANSGSTVTITGTNFDTHLYNDLVRVNQTRATVTSASSTSIQIKVPGATGSGHVVVATPQGTSTGPDLYIPPNEILASKVGATGRFSFGGSITPNFTVAEKVGLEIFEGTAGQRVSLVLSNSTIPRGYVTIWGPEGAKVQPSEASFTESSGGMVEPVTLPTTGTYTILVTPEGTGSVKISGYSVVDLTGSVTPTTEGATKSVSITTPGQNARYTVAGTAGQIVSVTTASTSFTGNYKLEWVNPEGRVIAENRYYPNENAFFEAVKFPSNGNYTLVVNPEGTVTGSTTLKVYNAADVTGTITPTEAGETKTITIGVPGQKARYTFSGTEGQHVSLVLANSTIRAGYVSILNSEGSKISTEEGFSESSGGMLEPVRLPATGTYTILLNGQGAYTGSVKLSAYSVVDLTGSITPTTEGATKALTISTPGQNARYTVGGTAGQIVSVTTASTSFTGNYTLEWVNAEGRVIAENRYSGTENAFFEAVKFPSNGNYTLVVNPEHAVTGSTTLKVYNAPDVTGTITPTTEGESKTVTISAPGQKGRITFSGTSGQVVTIKASEATIASGTMVILNSEGSGVSGEVNIGGAGGRIELTLPATGTFTIFLHPSAADTGSVKLTAYLGSHLSPVRPPGGRATPRSAAMLASGSGAATAKRANTHTMNSSHRRPAEYKHARGGAIHNVSRSASKAIYAPAFRPHTSDAWTPLDPGARHHTWETRWPFSPWTHQALPQAPYGQTGLSGQALKLNGLPLAGVRFSIDGTTASTTSDNTGRFLLTGLPAGHHVLVIEGPSIRRGERYGTFEVGVDLAAHKTTMLEETVWMTPLDRAGDHRVSSPTKHEVTVTTPQIPGLEVRIPAGTVITDASGRTIRKLNLTAIPVDRPPFPLPPFVEVPVYFTAQPGRAYLSKGAQIIYPNYTHLPAGQRVPFWNYDAGGRGWYVYGHGTVTPNGKQVIPDPDVRVWEFTGAMVSGNPTPPASGPHGGPTGGDPVDLYTGLLTYHKTDLVLPDTLPIVVERSYRQADTNSYSFGIGTTSMYDMRLWSENNFHEADLILPDGGRVHYVRTSEGTGFKEAVYKSTNLPGRFFGSTIKWDEAAPGWDLTLTSGITYVFGEVAPLQAIRDRYGNQLTLTREHGQTGNITQITSPHGRWVTFAYDSSNRITEIKDNGGRVLKYEYTSGLLTKVTDAAERVTKYEYDSSNNMTNIVDARGTKYLENKYDANDRVSKQTNADGGVFEYSYALNGSKAESTTITEPRENKRKITFNSEGFTTSETFGLGTSIEQTTQIERQAATGLVLSTTDARNRKTTYEYNAYGNTTSATRLAGTSSAQTTKYTYEPNTNKVTKITDPLNHSTTYEYGPKGELTTLTDPLTHKTTFEYNSGGQMTVVKNALGKKSTLTYELGDLTAVVDPLGRTTRQFVDSLGRVASVTRPEGQRTVYAYDADNEQTSITSPSGALTSLEYDADGDLTGLTDPRHNKTTAAYDSLDRVESETDPLGHTARWVYNTAGFPSETTSRRGLVTKLTYDALGRMATERFGVSGETAQSTITPEYDNGNRLKKVEDSATGTYTLGYDELDNLTSLIGPNGTVEYTYDSANRRKKMTVPGQEPINYTFDEANRLTELTRGTQVTRLGYNAANLRTSVKLPDAIEEQYGYSEANQPTSIIYKTGTETLGELDYAYNLDGQTEAMWGSYARTGLPEAVSSMVYNADNELTERASKTLTYDNDGNLTSDGFSEYKWDARGQLETMTGGTTLSFAYDPFGRRASKTIGGTTTKLLYDGPNVIQETAGSTTNNLFTGLQPDQLFSRTTSAGTESYLTNLSRSTIGLGNSEGKVKTTYTYDPFGGTATEGTASSNTFQYTGRENDTTGLQYNRARYYNPASGRFISQDPAGFRASGPNLYQYTAGNPIDSTDPSGHEGSEFELPPPPWEASREAFQKAGETALEPAVNAAKEHPGQAAEYTAELICVAATDGVCTVVTDGALGIDLGENWNDATCHGSTNIHEFFVGGVDTLALAKIGSTAASLPGGAGKLGPVLITAAGPSLAHAGPPGGTGGGGAGGAGGGSPSPGGSGATSSCK